MDHAMEQQDIAARLQAMTSLEKSQGHLSPTDYLSPHYIHPRLQHNGLHDDLLKSFPDHEDGEGRVITQAFRMEMIAWFHDFVELCHCERDCVVYAVSFMDRYLSMHKCSVDMLRLVGSICIFLAVKIHGGQCVRFPLRYLVKLWNGYFTMKDFEMTERSILLTFNYRMHPLCAHDFMMECLRALKPMIPISKRWSYVQKMSSRLCQDASLFHYVFVNKNASSVGLGCILAVLDGFSQESFSMEQRQQFFHLICDLAKFSEGDLDEVVLCHGLLWDIYSTMLYHYGPTACSPWSPETIMTTCDSNSTRISPCSISQQVLVPPEKHDSATQLFIEDDCDEVEAVRIFR